MWVGVRGGVLKRNVEEEEVNGMSELEDFKASKESRDDVVSRAGRAGSQTAVVAQLVEAACYRETHHTEPAPSTEDKPEPADGSE